MKKSKGRRDSTRAEGDTNEPADSSKTFPIVCVGASAGGMEAFNELLRHIPLGTGLAFVLIQHLDPTHPSYLSEALARSTSFPVDEIKDGMRVESNHVYVIPSNADVGILRGTLALLPRPAASPSNCAAGTPALRRSRRRCRSLPVRRRPTPS